MQPGDGVARHAGGQTTRYRQGLPGLWSWTFGAGTWRAVIYGLLCWVLVVPAGPNTVRNVLLYPLTDGSTAARSWGGPSLAGAWAVHAALALVLLPLELWALRGLTGLQAGWRLGCWAPTARGGCCGWRSWWRPWGC